MTNKQETLLSERAGQRTQISRCEGLWFLEVVDTPSRFWGEPWVLMGHLSQGPSLPGVICLRAVCPGAVCPWHISPWYHLSQGPSVLGAICPRSCLSQGPSVPGMSLPGAISPRGCLSRGHSVPGAVCPRGHFSKRPSLPGVVCPGGLLFQGPSVPGASLPGTICPGAVCPWLFVLEAFYPRGHPSEGSLSPGSSLCPGLELLHPCLYSPLPEFIGQGLFSETTHLCTSAYRWTVPTLTQPQTLGSPDLVISLRPMWARGELPGLRRLMQVPRGPSPSPALWLHLPSRMMHHPILGLGGLGAGTTACSWAVLWAHRSLHPIKQSLQH